MNQIEQYDQRIARIMSKIKDLHHREYSFSCGKWPPVWEPPVSEEEAAAFEAEKGIRLPEDYRRFITTIAGAGSQPFYGLLPLRQKESAVEQPFPYTPDHILYFLYRIRPGKMQAVMSGKFPGAFFGFGIPAAYIRNSHKRFLKNSLDG